MGVAELCYLLMTSTWRCVFSLLLYLFYPPQFSTMYSFHIMTRGMNECFHVGHTCFPSTLIAIIQSQHEACSGNKLILYSAVSMCFSGCMLLLTNSRKAREMCGLKYFCAAIISERNSSREGTIFPTAGVSIISQCCCGWSMYTRLVPYECYISACWGVK